MTIVWPGEPGDSYTNAGDKILYQLVCSGVNTCGMCWQYNLAVAKWWSKLHRGCNCESRPIYPGQESAPYKDWRKLIANLPEDQQVKVVGASNWKLLEAGAVKWEDVVTSNRVRLLREVVSREKLTIDQMVKAGVKKQFADAAWQTVNTPAHQHAAHQQAQLITQIQQLGIQPKHLREMFGEKMAQRVGIFSGPSGTSRAPGGRSDAAWVKLLQGSLAAHRAQAAIAPKAPIATSEELGRLREMLADDPLEWLAEIARGLRRGVIYPRELLEEYKRLGGGLAD